MATTIYGRAAMTVPDRFYFKPGAPSPVGGWGPRPVGAFGPPTGGSEDAVSHAQLRDMFTQFTNGFNQWAQTALPNWLIEEVTADAISDVRSVWMVAQADYSTSTDPPTVRARFCTSRTGSGVTGAPVTVYLPYPKGADDEPLMYPNVRSGQVFSARPVLNAADEVEWEGDWTCLDAPLGAVWAHYDLSTPPATTVRQGWTLIAQGRFLVGYKSGDASYGTVGNTGGYDKHGTTENNHSNHGTHEDHVHLVPNLSEAAAHGHAFTGSASQEASPGHTHTFAGNGMEHDHALCSDGGAASVENDPHTHCLTLSCQLAASGADFNALDSLTSDTTDANTPAIHICGCTELNTPTPSGSNTCTQVTITPSGTNATHQVTVVGDWVGVQKTTPGHAELNLEHAAHSDSDNRPKYLTVMWLRRTS